MRNDIHIKILLLKEKVKKVVTSLSIKGAPKYVQDLTLATKTL